MKSIQAGRKASVEEFAMKKFKDKKNRKNVLRKTVVFVRDFHM